MNSALRNACFIFSHSLNPTPNPNAFPLILYLHSLQSIAVSRLPLRISRQEEPYRSAGASSFSSSSSMAGTDAEAPASSSLVEKQFEHFRSQLQDSGSLRDRIRSVAMEIESSTRLMQASLLLVHQSRFIPEVLEKPKAQVGLLKSLYKQLAEILRESPGLYYRYHGDWRSETQTAVSLLAFIHWLETGELLLHPEAEEKLGLNESDFSMDVEDYLIGICFMSNELPRYVVNQVTVGDYDCPRKTHTDLCIFLFHFIFPYEKKPGAERFPLELGVAWYSTGRGFPKIVAHFSALGLHYHFVRASMALFCSSFCSQSEWHEV